MKRLPKNIYPKLNEIDLTLEPISKRRDPTDAWNFDDDVPAFIRDKRKLTRKPTKRFSILRNKRRK